MARGRLEGGEGEKERKKKKKRHTDADGQCRLVYQNGIVGAIVALLDTPFVGYIQAVSPGLLNPFFHSLSETLFIFLLSLLHRRVTRTELEEATRAKRCRRVVSPFALSTVISLKSNCTRKNGSPLSGKRIAQLEGGRLSRALSYT